jgi:hypothetical protein
MRASLDSTAQLAVLADLGIEVWRLRGVPEPLEASETIVEPRPIAPEPPETLRPAEGGVSVPAVTATRVAGAASAMSAGPASGAAPGRSDPAFSLVTLGQSGALLLLAAEPVGREARFARDLLAAAAGHYRDAPVLRRFDWPPAPGLPGIDQPGASDRALAAFLDKARADADARHLLVDTVVAARVAELGLSMPLITLPALADLARDGNAKRTLWLTLSAAVVRQQG